MRGSERPRAGFIVRTSFKGVVPATTPGAPSAACSTPFAGVDPLRAFRPALKLEGRTWPRLQCVDGAGQGVYQLTQL
jgi:hypothetical protein